MNIIAMKDSAFTPEQMKLITSTVARGATPDELALFLYRCKNMGLDPLKPGQVHFIKYGNNPGTIVTGIDGFRAKAHRSKLLSGIKRGVLRDDKGACVGGWAEVSRKDWTSPARAEVSLSEYSTGKAMWAKMPETMIQKVAEAAALRMAFPDDLSGLYTEEETHKLIEEGKGLVNPEQPPVGDGIQEDGYVMPAIAGRLAGKLLHKISKEDLDAFLVAIETKYEGKEIPPKTKEMYQKAHERRMEFEAPIIGDEEEPGEFQKF